MQLVQDREALRLFRVERSRKHDAVGDAAGKYFAGDGVAFDAAGSERRRDVKQAEDEENGELGAASGENERRQKAKEKAVPSLLSGWHLHLSTLIFIQSFYSRLGLLGTPA